MAVSYSQNFNDKDIRNFIRKKIAIVEEVIRDQLIDVAEQFVADARSLNTYTDRTRNLRGSLGYSLMKDGVVLQGNFEGKPEGQAEARKKILEIRGQFPRGYALFVVAGMEYAVYVEAKGYDVITGPSLTAESSIRRQFARIEQQLKKIK